MPGRNGAAAAAFLKSAALAPEGSAAQRSEAQKRWMRVQASSSAVFEVA